MKLVPEFTGWWPDIGKKLPMEIPVRKGLDRYGCKTSENTLREFPLVITTVAKVSRKRGLWLVVRVNTEKNAPPDRPEFSLQPHQTMRLFSL